MHTFYNIDSISIQKKKKIINEAIYNCYEWHVDKLDCSKSFMRQQIKMSFEDIMLKLKTKSHFQVIHRRNLYDGEYGEIGFCQEEKGVTYFLWIFVTLEELEKLTKKYKLNERVRV
mgnify:CR=1 FL=1